MPSNVRPEMQLMLCCARTRIDESTSARIRKLLSGEIDWTDLVTWALWHHVTPLLHRSLREVAPSEVPSDILHALDINVSANRAHLDFLTRELLDLLDSLATEGIEAIPFKGPVLGAYLYDDVGLRVFGDLDFLLHEEDVDRALDALARRGYREKIYHVNRSRTPAQERAFRRYSGQYAIVRDDRRVVIEPHWALSQSMFVFNIAHAGLFQRVSSVTLNGKCVPTFAPRDLPLILCTHGFREQWIRLKWVCDIAELLHRDPALDWEEICEDAREQGCLRLVLLGLVVANRFLEAPLPVVVADKARADRVIPQLVAQVEEHLLRQRIKPPKNWKINRFRLMGRERMRDKLAYMARTQLMPNAAHFDLVRLPDALFFCYYPIRWVYDYVILPAWTLAKTVGLVRRETKQPAGGEAGQD